MRTKLIIMAAIFFTVNILAQSPQKMSYQAVIRNSSNQLVGNTQVGMKISILQEKTDGKSVYSETLTPTTNANGLISIEFGGGAGFESINWADGPYFLKTETDPDGGTNYTITGTSQLLSVPYALYAETSGNNVLPNYSQAEIDALTPYAGMQVFNTDYKIQQLYDGAKWNGYQSSCVPKPNTPNPGPNQLGIQSTSTVLAGNVPSFGVRGKWTIVEGEGGVLSDDTSPTSTFTGSDQTLYKLQWFLMSDCDTASTYAMKITFFSNPPVISFNGYNLYAYPRDNAQVQWGGYDITTSAVSDTNGEANTKAIIDSLGDNGGVPYAAKVCDTLTAYGYTDWYLPAKEELKAIHGIENIFISDLEEYNHWSSTETTPMYASYSGACYKCTYNKKSALYVRCVRKE